MYVIIGLSADENWLAAIKLVIKLQALNYCVDI